MARRRWTRLKRVVPKLRNLAAPGAVILLYHRVTELAVDPHRLAVSPAHFQEHLDVIRRVGVPCSLRDLTERMRHGRSIRRAVVVTFDDGYADNLENGVPLLERYDVPATVFAASGQVGRPREFAWDELSRSLLEGPARDQLGRDPRPLH